MRFSPHRFSGFLLSLLMARPYACNFLDNALRTAHGFRLAAQVKYCLVISLFRAIIIAGSQTRM